MMKIAKSIKTYIILAIVTLLPSLVSANTIRTISSREGLSNNAILSMYQDNIGHIWIGTTDGLNIWNGHSLELYDPKDGKNFFSGNAIREIWPDHAGSIWTLTYYGIAKIQLASKEITYYGSFGSTPTMICDEQGGAYVIASDNSFHYYDQQSKEFIQSHLKFLSEDEACKRLIYQNGRIFCFTNQHIYILAIKSDEKLGKITPSIQTKIEWGCHFASPTFDGNICYILDQRERNIHTFDLDTREIVPYALIGSKISQQEKIRAVLPHEDNLYIALSMSGVYKCISGHNEMSSTPITSSVFCMLRDKMQDIIWVGTDGKGVIQWSQNNIHFEEVTYDRLPISVQMPSLLSANE